MSTEVIQSMDSYRLAQYSVQHECFICDGGNSFDAELCRHCFAPMALTRQAASQKTKPRLMAAVGAPAAGKTVYLGMLADMLSRENGPLQLLARGAFSVSLQQETMASLSQCRFPDKTPNEPDRWNWLHAEIKSPNRRKPLDLVMPDLAGEALQEEIDHTNSYPVIRQFLQKCAGLMILIDVSRIEEGGQDQDFFGMKLISYLCELNENRKKGWPNRPITVIFTKADCSDACFDNPMDYARKHTSGLWQQSNERLRKCQFFASTVAGACAWEESVTSRVQFPLRIEPRGIVEPFVWLVDQM